MNRKDRIRRAVKKDLGSKYDEMRWLSPSAARLLNSKFHAKLKALSKRIDSSFFDHKPHYGDLSRGCQICGSGGWSCMFLTFMCSANCHFCPTIRKGDTVPEADRIKFDKAVDYADYLVRFGYKGSSFSGGDPIIKFEKLILYLKTMRKKLGDDFYIWMYTNGLLIDESKLKKLKEAGLNEIRFDIAATDYNLDKVRIATKYIDVVTVEIPAIPEDFDRLVKLLPLLKKYGIKHLNLHELITSRVNIDNFIERGYTFLHNARHSILESLMTALDVVECVLDKKIGIPVNVCTLAYKQEVQLAGTYRRWSHLARQEYEGVTETGYIRQIYIQDDLSILNKYVQSLKKDKTNDKLWYFDKKDSRLFVHHSLIEKIPCPDEEDECFTIAYYQPSLVEPQGNGNHDGKDIKINKGRTIHIMRHLISEMEPADKLQMIDFKDYIVNASEPPPDTSKARLKMLKKYKDVFLGLEHIRRGLPEIF